LQQQLLITIPSSFFPFLFQPFSLYECLAIKHHWRRRVWTRTAATAAAAHVWHKWQLFSLSPLIINSRMRMRNIRRERMGLMSEKSARKGEKTQT
jgi:hypothetical protein